MEAIVIENAGFEILICDQIEKPGRKSVLIRVGWRGLRYNQELVVLLLFPVSGYQKNRIEHGHWYGTTGRY
ncbi:MAG TPA: hypothetical protein VN376_01035 [Longilinea sp.]|nr:hypothetical protein [Longilinea sp.]